VSGLDNDIADEDMEEEYFDEDDPNDIAEVDEDAIGSQSNHDSDALQDMSDIDNNIHSLEDENMSF